MDDMAMPQGVFSFPNPIDAVTRLGVNFSNRDQDRLVLAQRASSIVVFSTPLGGIVPLKFRLKPNREQSIDANKRHILQSTILTAPRIDGGAFEWHESHKIPKRTATTSSPSWRLFWP